jgi:cytochrome c peroxidase
MRILLLFCLLMLSVCADDALRQKALSKGLKSIPLDFGTLKEQVDDENNPMTLEKIKLGRKLFNDKNLSLDRTISCASCHDITKGGEDSIPTAIGYKKQKNPKHLNTPTVLNAAYSKHFFWDGRASSLRAQAKGPIQAHFEMASTPKLIEQRTGLSFDEVASAIAVYEKTLVTRGRFDEYLDGDDNALNDKEKRGLNLFIDLGCKGCHFGPSVGGQRIQKFPLRDYNSIVNLTTIFNEKTKGRDVKDFSVSFKMYKPYPFENIGGFLGKNNDRKFRVPILRNISKTAPYFHNGIVKNLRDAIQIMSKHQIGVELDDEQLDALEAFLKSLDGDLVKFKELKQ